MQINATVPDNIVEQLDDLAKSLGMSRSALICMILTIMTKKYEWSESTDPTDKLIFMFTGGVVES